MGCLGQTLWLLGSKSKGAERAKGAERRKKVLTHAAIIQSQRDHNFKKKAKMEALFLHVYALVFGPEEKEDLGWEEDREYEEEVRQVRESHRNFLLTCE